MKRRGIGLAAAAVLLLGACGSDKKSESTSASGAPAASSTAAPTTAVGGLPATTAASTCALESPLKIGYAADLSEVAAFADQPGSEAAKVMVDQLNAAGGVGGQPIQYVVKDIQGDPAATQRAAQELLDDGVSAMIGPPFASTGAPLLDAVGGKVPIIFMSSTDPSLADPSRGAFLASFSDPVQSAAMAQFATKKGLRKAVTFSSTDDVYFSNNPAYFKDAFEHAGGTVLQDYAFSLADTDFSTQVNAIASASDKPDVLFTAMIMPQIQTLLEQLQANGLEDVTVMGVDGFDATVVWSAGAVANGVFFSAHTFPQPDNGVQAFLDKASAAGAKIETISFGALAADAVQVIAAAATAACSTDGPTLSKAIDGLENVAVTTGTVSYAGTKGVPAKNVTVLTVTDGKPAFVEAFRPDYIPTA